MKNRETTVLIGAMLLLVSGMAMRVSAQSFYGEDTYLHRNKTNDNFSTEIFMQLRSDDSKFERRGLMKFDLTSLTSTVSQATLRLYSETQDGWVDAVIVEDNSWDVTTVTWSTKPVFGGVINGATAITNSWFEIDVTSYIPTGGVYSIGLTTPVNSVGKVTSSEGSNIPVLEIVTGPITNQPPEFLEDPIIKPDAKTDQPYSDSLANDAEDPNYDPLTFSLLGGPTWLNVASNGALSGTPLVADVGTNSFTVQVSDGQTNDTATLQILVEENLPPAFLTDPIEKGTTSIDIPCTGSLAGDASDPNGDSLSFSLTGGPAWLSVAANGTLSGTPLVGDLGTNSFTVQVSDGITNDTATLRIIVAENSPPVFISDPVVEITATRDIEYLASLSGSAGDMDLDPLTFSLLGGPAWLNVSSNGLLGGTPAIGDVGTNSWTLQVASEGGSDTTTLEITVVDPPLGNTNHVNIVLVYIDDLGWMDLSCQGSEFYETPHIDRLATEGMRFTQGYTPYPRCLPARYGVLTGRNPGRDAVPGGGGLVPGAGGTYTMAEALRDGGYATFFAGKWHLSGGDEQKLPHNQGFDTNIGGGDAGGPPTYFYPYRRDEQLQAPPHDGLDKDGFYHLGDINDYDGGARLGEYITDRLTDETIDWMRQHTNEPMFIYLSHYAVHGPFNEAPPEGLGTNPEFTALIQKYHTKTNSMDYGDLPEEIASGVGRQKMRQNFPTYAAMIEKVDESVGRVMAELEALGIADNTIIVFTADNGGLSNAGGYNGRTLATANYPLRTGKGWLYEGGIREAFTVKWPGVVAAGVVNTNDVVVGTDLYPTFLDIAGLPLQTNTHVDGISFVSALTNGSFVRTDPIIWHSPAARPYSTGDFNGSAIRVGDYKLIDWYDTPNGTELYNIVEDIEENHNLVEEMPVLASNLLAQVRAWRENPGVVVNPAEVSKPPSPYLDDPGAPVYGSVSGDESSIDLNWDHWIGFNFDLVYKTNLLDEAWTPHTSGMTTTNISIPIGAEQRRFFRVELDLLPQS